MNKPIYSLLIFVFLFFSGKASAGSNNSLVTFLGKVIKAEDSIPVEADIFIIQDGFPLDTLKTTTNSKEQFSKSSFIILLNSNKKYSFIIKAKNYLYLAMDIIIPQQSVLSQVFVLNPKKIICGPTIRNIYFESGKYTINIEDKLELYKLAEVIKNNPELRLRLIGNTDSSEKNVQELSLKRAIVVKDCLLSKEVNPQQLQVKGKGNKYPIALNNLSEGRAKNRRVEFEIAEIK